MEPKNTNKEQTHLLFCWYKTSDLNPPLSAISHFNNLIPSVIERFVPLQHHLQPADTFLAATKQLYKWFSPSVRLSSLSVRHIFLTMIPSSYHHEMLRSYYQWLKWCPCKRSRSEVKGQAHRGHIPIYPFPDCNSSFNWSMAIKWCRKLEAT